ncbi:MAG: DUF5615 family PIN-like protein [Candidatus Binatia bacterium]
MKFLVDANLPPRLCGWLKSRRHEAEHLFDLNLLTATDTRIWQRGRVENFVIFTKDVDFTNARCFFWRAAAGHSRRGWELQQSPAF